MNKQQQQASQAYLLEWLDDLWVYELGGQVIGVQISCSTSKGQHLLVNDW